jgi:4-amino-4-deoxychorismate lyase
VTAAPLQQGFSTDPFNLELDALMVKDTVCVHLDTQATESSIFTSTKTTFREVYDAARSRKNIPPLTAPQGRSADVLLYNPAGLITETSIANVAFFRDGKWLTPAASTGCLPGVSRRWLLEHSRIHEDNDRRLTVQSITDGEPVLLLNGLHGCYPGRINSQKV